MNLASATYSRYALPDDIPWEQSVGLLIDGVQVEDLLKRLYQWTSAATIEVLYLGGRFTALRQMSPCLVRIESDDDPVLAKFLQNLDQQWGYLLISDEPWQRLVSHLRWLLSVEHPCGHEVLLRIAYPAVADALFGPGGSTLFGPCQRVLTANPINGEWRQYSRSGATFESDHTRPYRLSEKEWLSLDSASAHKTVTALSEHMTRYFPEYYPDLTAEERNEHLHELVKRAAEHGFESEKELYLYCNAHGFVGQQGLQDRSYAMLLQPQPWDQGNTRRAEILASSALIGSQP